MGKLYELSESYKNLLELLDNPDIPQEVIQDALGKIDEEIEMKVENIAKVIKSLEVDIKGLKEEEQRLSSRRKFLENKVDNLKTYIEENMKATGKGKINGKVFTIAIQKNAPSVNINDLNAIPTEYFVVTKEISKNNIRST